MNKEKITRYIENGNTLLGIGPMSINTVDAAVEIANETDIPIMLIASRRQIDDKSIQRGYVNNWSTDEFAKYIRKRQLKDNIILARDHGGPWQNNIEINKNLDINDAMKSAKESYLKDIEAGFDILHIDPSIDIYHQLSFDCIFERLTDLYEFCTEAAIKEDKDIEFEVGTEEQLVNLNPINEYKSMLHKIKFYCQKRNFKIPLFVVTQIGTKVMETKNIGILNYQNNIRLYEDIKLLSDAAKEEGIFIKVHNTDYLNNTILKHYPKLGIHAANVAPEFGVCETISFLNLLEQNYLLDLENDFLELAYNSKKWNKWVIYGSKLSKKEKAILAGHYIFSDEKYIKIKENAQRKIKGTDIDEYLKSNIKKNIMKYINNFNTYVNNETGKICIAQ